MFCEISFIFAVHVIFQFFYDSLGWAALHSLMLGSNFESVNRLGLRLGARYHHSLDEASVYEVLFSYILLLASMQRCTQV